jgi:anti-sigma factor RsiW
MTFDAEHPGDLLSAYLDGELSAGEQAAVADHLAGCPWCREELAATTWPRGLLRRLPEPSVPAGLIERTLIHPRRRAMPLAWTAAAAAVLALSLVASGSPGQGPPPGADRLVQAHAASTGADPVSGLAPAAVPASFSP